MKNNWETKRLGDITTLVKGKKPKLFSKNGTKPYLTAKVIRGTEEPEMVDSKCPVSVWANPEDIVIIMDGSNSGEMFTGLDGALASTMGILRFDEKVLSPRYLLSFLITHRENFTKSRTGAAIPHLNKEEFENLELPVPSLVEQGKIVKILDEAFEKIDKTKENSEKNLHNSKQLFESYLQSVFVQFDCSTILSDVAKVIGGFSFKSGDFKKYGQYQVLRMGNVRPGIIRENENPVFISDVDQITLQRALLRLNDVIITQTGTKGKRDYGFTAIINASNYLLNQRISAIRFNDNYLPKFFLYYSWTNLFKDQYFANETGTVGQGNVGIGAISSALIPSLSIAEQRVIIQKLDTLFEQTIGLQASYKQKIADLDELKKSVLTKAFAGEL